MKNELIYIIFSVDILIHYNTQFVSIILSDFIEIFLFLDHIHLTFHIPFKTRSVYGFIKFKKTLVKSTLYGTLPKTLSCYFFA